MRIDLFTKTVLTIIALLLAVVASRQYIDPASVSAQSSLTGVQMAVTPVGYTFFDSRTGELWEYNGPNLRSRYRLTKLGQALTPEK
jgi:hypothetical protein